MILFSVSTFRNRTPLPGKVNAKNTFLLQCGCFSLSAVHGVVTLSKFHDGYVAEVGWGGFWYYKFRVPRNTNKIIFQPFYTEIFTLFVRCVWTGCIRSKWPTDSGNNRKIRQRADLSSLSLGQSWVIKKQCTLVHRKKNNIF